MLYEYMLSMGQMNPEMEQLKRRQSMVDALRAESMGASNPTRMAGRVVAPTGLGDMIGKLGQGYMAQKGQKEIDPMMQGMNARQAALLEQLRRRARGMTGDGSMDLSDRNPQEGY